MNKFDMLLKEVLELPSARHWEYIPKGKKNGTIVTSLMDAKDKAETIGDTIKAWRYGNMTGLCYTLKYTKNGWK